MGLCICLPRSRRAQTHAAALHPQLVPTHEASGRLLIPRPLPRNPQEYAEEAKLKELVARYSEFINFPILMEVCGVFFC